MSLRVLVVLPIILLLSACTPEATEPVVSAAPTVAASTATPTPTPTDTSTAKGDADPADYLLDGTPGVFDADGVWKGHYGFYTDETRSVRCDVWVFSGDSGGVTCAVTPGSESLVAYALPPVDCAPDDGNPVDGYSVAINDKVFATGSVGWQGCHLGSSDFADVTKVLPGNRRLTVQTDRETYTCTVDSGVASCSDENGAGVVFGLPLVEFHG